MKRGGRADWKGVFRILGLALVAACSRQEEAPPAPVPTVTDESIQIISPDTIAWSYAGDSGPAGWGRLHPDFALCATGGEQSPVDLPIAADGDGNGNNLPDPIFQYGPSPLDWVYDGKRLKLVYEPGSWLRLGSGEWQLRELHFHHPSEHTVGGRSFPLEMQLLHEDADGYPAILAVFLSEGAENPAFAPLLEHLPAKAGTEVKPEGVSVLAEDLLPAERQTWRYSGSLTQPPCSEGVQWIVFRQPVELSPAQIERLRTLLGDNHRPVQAKGERTIEQDSGVDQEADPDPGA